jgi:hypothetical protein
MRKWTLERSRFSIYYIGDLVEFKPPFIPMRLVTITTLRRRYSPLLKLYSFNLEAKVQPYRLIYLNIRRSPLVEPSSPLNNRP